MQVQIVGTGTVALLMHNSQLASPLNPYAKKLKSLSGKRNKTDDDRLEMSRIEFEGGLYYDEVLGPVIPQNVLFSAIVAGAKMDKNGQKVLGGVSLGLGPYPLVYKGPRKPDEMWDDGRFTNMQIVRVGQAKVDRTRAIFKEWSFEAEAELDTTVIEFYEFETAVTKAGKFKGVGDYRQLYGRFDAKVAEL
jgi:hypothetical protein